MDLTGRLFALDLPSKVDLTSIEIVPTMRVFGGSSFAGMASQAPN